MKRMLFVLSVVALFCMSSCSSYYYSVLESNDAVGEKNDDKDFVIENDSVCISYCFMVKMRLYLSRYIIRWMSLCLLTGNVLH